MKTPLFSLIRGIYSSLFILGIALKADAQSWKWAHQGSSEGFEYGNAIVIDDSANVYVTGQIEYTALFDNGIHLTSNGKHDILHAKYNSAGQLIWARHAGGVSGDVGWGIGLDQNRNIYTIGEFEYTAGFSAGDSITVYGSNDIFLSKFDNAGNYLWAQHFGGSSDDKGKAIAVDTNGDCYITGYFSSNGNFGSVNLTSSSSSNDVFIAKTNSSGVIQWAKKGGGTKEDRGRGIVLDGQGNVYITGTFTTSATFNGNTITSTGTNSLFVAKYDVSGNFKWVRGAGACCDTTRGNAITVDQSGNVYIAGYFKDQTTIGSNSFTSLGSADVIVIKYDPNGNVVWAKQAGGPYEDMAYACVFDTLKNQLYVTGQIDDHGNFGSIYVGAAGNRDVFIAAYDPSGNELWARPGGGNQRDAGQAVTYDALGNIYTTGFFNDTASFGTSILQGYSLADFYVGKMAPPLATQPTVSTTGVSSQISGCTDLQLSMTPGDGTRRIIIASAGAPVSMLPVDGNYYTASSVFGSGSDLGLGNFVVYDGAGSSVTLSGLSAGVTYYFRIVEYNGVGFASNYLTSGAASFSTTVTPFQLSLTADQTAICNGGAATIHASQASTYSWTPSTGLSSTTDSVVTASPASATTYTVTATNGQGCSSTSTINITVGTTPTVTFSNLGTVCSSVGNVTLSGGSPAGGTYSGTGVSGGIFNPASLFAGTYILTYTYTNSSGCSASDTSAIVVNASPTVTISSLSAVCTNGSPLTLTNGSPAGGTYSGSGVSGGIFTPSAAGAGSKTITYSYTGANGCQGSANTTIQVNALPTITFTTPSSICSAQSAITLTASPSGGTFSGNGVTGTTFDPLAAGSGTSNLTYTYTDANNCTNTAVSSITVNTTPTVTLSSMNALCSGATAITLTNGSPSGGTYSGTGVSGNTFNPATSGAGTFTINYSYTSANGCSGSASNSITVNAAPAVSFSAPAAVCQNSSPVTLTGGSPAGGSYSGSNVNAGVFTPATAGNNTITYSLTDANGCTGTAAAVMTVYALPTVSAGTYQPMCSNSSPIILSGGTPSGGTYNGQGVSGTTFTPSSVSGGSSAITYSFTDNHQCTASATTNITVNTAPTVTLSAIPSQCQNGTPLTLTQGSPSGGVYSGTGVSANTFNPSVSGTGAFSITYTYTDSHNCSNSANSMVFVNTNPTVAQSSFPASCANSGMVTLTGGSPTGGTYAGNGASGTQFNTSVGQGFYNLTYTYTNSNGCSGTASAIMTVNPSPAVNLGPDSLACADATIQLSEGSGFSSVNWSTGATGSSISVDSSGTGYGVKTVSVVVQNNYGCTARDTINITFDPCQGLSHLSDENIGVFVFPNPFNDAFTIFCERSAEFRIFDISGREISHQKITAGSQIAGENLAAGTYFIEITAGDKRKMIQVVKSR